MAGSGSSVQVNQYQRALDRLQAQINALIDRLARLEAAPASATSGRVVAGSAISTYTRAQIDALLAGRWPVGSVFIAEVGATPAALGLSGTWIPFGSGRVLVGLDSGDPDFDTLGETGGSK